MSKPMSMLMNRILGALLLAFLVGCASSGRGVRSVSDRGISFEDGGEELEKDEYDSELEEDEELIGDVDSDFDDGDEEFEEDEPSSKSISSTNFEEDPSEEEEPPTLAELESSEDFEQAVEEEMGDELPPQRGVVLRRTSPPPRVQAEITPPVLQPQPKRRKASIARKSRPKNGFYRLKSDCNVRSTPGGKRIAQVDKGRRIWVDYHNKRWVKIYRKKGPAFISRVCLKGFR